MFGTGIVLRSFGHQGVLRFQGSLGGQGRGTLSLECLVVKQLVLEEPLALNLVTWASLWLMPLQ